jgi:hypothetical protein
MHSSFRPDDEFAGIGPNFGLRVCSTRHLRSPPRPIQCGIGGSTRDLNFRIEWAIGTRVDPFLESRAEIDRGITRTETGTLLRTETGTLFGDGNRDAIWGRKPGRYLGRKPGRYLYWRMSSALFADVVMPRRARVAPGGFVYHVLNRSIG